MEIHYKKLTEKELDTFIKMRIQQLWADGAKELLVRVVEEAKTYGCGTVQIMHLTWEICHIRILAL